MQIEQHHAATLAKLSGCLLSLSLLASCGGGDAYTGLWEGDLGSGAMVTGMVLPDGEYYLLYSQPTNAAVLAGMVKGTADFEAARIRSDDAVDFRWPGALAQRAVLTGRIGKGGTVNGSVNGKNFSAKPVPDAPLDARLADIAGRHQGVVVFVLGSRDAVFDVDASGNVSTVINECSISGKVTPMPEVNAYHLKMTFGGGVCAFNGVTFSGVTFFDRDQRKLHAAVTATLPGYGPQAIGFIGVKQ